MHPLLISTLDVVVAVVAVVDIEGAASGTVAVDVVVVVDDDDVGTAVADDVSLVQMQTLMLPLRQESTLAGWASVEVVSRQHAGPFHWSGRRCSLVPTMMDPMLPASVERMGVMVQRRGPPVGPCVAPERPDWPVWTFSLLSIRDQFNETVRPPFACAGIRGTVYMCVSSIMMQEASANQSDEPNKLQLLAALPSLCRHPRATKRKGESRGKKSLLFADFVMTSKCDMRGQFFGLGFASSRRLCREQASLSVRMHVHLSACPDGEWQLGPEASRKEV